MIIVLTILIIPTLPVSAELVALWQFEDGKGDVAKDSSGRGHDGILNGNKFDKGQVKGALRFDAGNFMEVPGHKDFNFTNKFTIAEWANIEDIPKDHVGIPGKGHDLPVGSFVFHPTKLGPDKYEVRFYISIGAAWPQAKTIDAIAFKQWHHLAGVYDGKEIKVYVDAKLAGSFKQEGDINITEDAPFKFANDCCGGRQLVGWLDEIYIFNHALNEDEIKKTMDGKILAVNYNKDLITTWGIIKSDK
jgi:hypothetical protein